MINFKAKKSLGQNFLKSEKALNEIVECSDIQPNEIILEIGPGKGALTEKLLEKAGKIITIEKDRRSVEFLEEKFEKEIKEGRLEILEADILNFDENSLNNYKVIANIPYYITGEILKKFLSSNNQPKSITVMVQKEIAERIVARDKKESILSISVKIFGNPKYVSTVKKENFNPKPKVDSAILYISDISKDKIMDPRFRGDDKGSEGARGRLSAKEQEERFFSIMKTGFSHKRKQLGSNLKDLNLSEDKFKECNLNKTDRAEDLSLEDWLCLSS